MGTAGQAVNPHTGEAHAGALATHPDMQLAEELAYTCYQGYQDMAAKLAPEIWHFKTDGAPVSACYGCGGRSWDDRKNSESQGNLSGFLS